MIERWAVAFALTQVVEVPVYRLAGRVPLGRAFLASALTHPVVWFGFFSPRFEARYETRFLLAEGFAVVVEAMVVARGRAPQAALAVALAANGASVLVGLLVRSLTGWP